MARIRKAHKAWNDGPFEYTKMSLRCMAASAARRMAVVLDGSTGRTRVGLASGCGWRRSRWRLPRDGGAVSVRALGSISYGSGSVIGTRSYGLFSSAKP